MTLASSPEEYAAIMYPEPARQLGSGDVCIFGRTLVKIVHVGGKLAKLAKIEPDGSVAIAHCPLSVLVPLEVAMSPKSTWIATNQADILAAIRQEEWEAVAEKERAKRAKKSRKSLKIKRGK